MSDVITQVQKGHEPNADDVNDLTLIDFDSNKDKKKSWFSWCCFSKSKEGYQRELDSANDFKRNSNQTDPKDGYKDYLLPPIRVSLRNRKCLVLDLDETLVHSSFKPVSGADFIVNVEIERVVHEVYVLKRPHVDDFLKYCGERFEVVIFTASLSKYADPVLDLLDKTKSVTYRLFRESCSPFKGNYVKDLSLLGRPMNTCIIIDNSPFSYLFQPENAFPITSWFDDPNDTELVDIIPYLDKLIECDDVVVTLDKFKKSKGFTFGGMGK